MQLFPVLALITKVNTELWVLPSSLLCTITCWQYMFHILNRGDKQALGEKQVAGCHLNVKWMIPCWANPSAFTTRSCSAATLSASQLHQCSTVAMSQSRTCCGGIYEFLFAFICLRHYTPHLTKFNWKLMKISSGNNLTTILMCAHKLFERNLTIQPSLPRSDSQSIHGHRINIQIERLKESGL